MDMLTGEWRECIPTYGKPTHPDTITVDAVFPFAPSTLGRVMIHAPSNMTTTSVALNFAKHTTLPASLAQMTFCHREIQKLKTDDSRDNPLYIEQLHCELMEQCRIPSYI